MIKKNKKSATRMIELVIILGIIVSVLVFVAVFIVYKNAATDTDFSFSVKVPAYARDIQAATGCTVPIYTISFISGNNYFSFPVNISGLKANSLCSSTGVKSISDLGGNTYDCSTGLGNNFDLIMGKGYTLLGDDAFRQVFSGSSPTFPITQPLGVGVNYVGIMSNCRLDFDEKFVTALPLASWSEVVEYSRDGATATNTPHSKEFSSFKPSLVYKITMASEQDWMYEL